MAKKTAAHVQKLRCACGRSINLVKEEDGTYKCTACLAGEDEKRRHGMPVVQAPPEPREPPEETGDD